MDSKWINFLSFGNKKMLTPFGHKHFQYFVDHHTPNWRK